MKYEELEWFDWEHYRKPPNFKDLTGEENNNFKILGRAPSIKSASGSYTTMWNCICKHCGEYCVKNTTNYRKHNSCGCIRGKTVGKKLTKDLSNQTFGWLTAIYKIGSNISGNAVWHCRCICGQEIDVDSNNLTTLHTTSCGCVKREKSIGAMNITKLLQQNGINYKTEITFLDLRGEKKHPYFYDFGIYHNDKLVRLIEYDGIQHYKETWGEWAKSKDTLEAQQQRDKIKNEYALSHNIPLVRIPYWMRDKITLEMLLGDEYLIK